jgi:hypothetical protein
MVGGKSARERLSEVVSIGELLAAAAAAASRLGLGHPKRISSSICLTFWVEGMLNADCSKSKMHYSRDCWLEAKVAEGLSPEQQR